MDNKEINSNECLEKISYYHVNDDIFQGYCNIIKKDLDRLEKLEKENQKLNTFNELQKSVIALMSSNSKLYELLTEYNDKLKNTIDIIKNKKVDIKYFLECADVSTYNFLACKEGADPLTQEEYELLKNIFRDIE